MRIDVKDPLTEIFGSETECGKCHTETKITAPVVYNSTTDDSISVMYLCQLCKADFMVFAGKRQIQ